MHMAIRCREYLRHTAAARIAYKINPADYTGGAGEGGGFQRNFKSALQESQMNASPPYK